LRGVELGNRWKDTASVASEKDNVAWVVRGQARDLGVLDVFDRIGTTSVFGQSSVIVIDKTGFWVENNVLQN